MYYQESFAFSYVASSVRLPATHRIMQLLKRTSAEVVMWIYSHWLLITHDHCQNRLCSVATRLLMPTQSKDFTAQLCTNTLPDSVSASRTRALKCKTLGGIRMQALDAGIRYCAIHYTCAYKFTARVKSTA